MITKEKQIKALLSLKKIYENSEKTISDLERVFGDLGDSPLFETTWASFDHAVSLTSELTCIPSDSLYWHIFDNAFGKEESVLKFEGDDYCIHDNTSFVEYENLIKNSVDLEG